MTDWVLRQTGALNVRAEETLQPLWSGYGELLRLHLQGGAQPSVILKKVAPPPEDESLSARRKLRSYAIERTFYERYAPHCQARVAGWLGSLRQGSSSWLLLEDLLGAGFQRTRSLAPEQIRAGLRWLAHFHVSFLGQVPDGLWPQGTYWHLETRPDEWSRMPSGPWKELAAALDRKLKSARFQTFVHGDAKPANFLWNGEQASAVDFQYVGGGCGIRDVAYFLDCCLDEAGCAREAAFWLDVYFDGLRELVSAAWLPDLEREWRRLFPLAWSDFFRFYQGWGAGVAPGAFTWEQLERARAVLQSDGQT